MKGSVEPQFTILYILYNSDQNYKEFYFRKFKFVYLWEFRFVDRYNVYHISLQKVFQFSFLGFYSSDVDVSNDQSCRLRHP